MATPTPSGTRSPNRLHPLLALAAVAIVIASLTAVAAITGVLPLASSANSPQGQNQPTQLAANSGVTDSAAPAPLDNLAPAAQSANQSTIPPADQPPPQAPQAPQANAAPAPDLQAQAPAPVNQYAPQQPPAAANSGYGTAPPPPASCRGCGTIVSIQEVQREGQSTGLGAVGGALAGGLVGNQFGGGGGRAAMTVLGAVGGGFAGNTVEKHLRSDVEYQVRVRTDDGHTRYFNYRNPPPYQQGQRIRVGKSGIEGSI